MKSMKGVFLVVLALLTISNAFLHITPLNKEVTYSWKALVKAGTYLPQNHASQFVLRGKIHLQTNTNSSLVKVTDLSYELYNGLLDHVHEKQAQTIPVPQEIQPLTDVFKVIYDTNGHVHGLLTEENEKEFSRNMKRAIANILQMDKSILDIREYPKGFAVDEPSIYGYSKVDYNVIPHHDWIEVHKWHEMNTSQHMYQYLVRDNKRMHCDIAYDEPLMHISKKRYVISKDGSDHTVKHIETKGALVYYQEKARAETQYLTVNQTFDLIAISPIKEEFHMKSAHFDDGLTYHPYEETEDGRIVDDTNGRRIVNYEKLMPLVKHMLSDIHEYLHEDHLGLEDPDTKRGQMINRVQRVLQWFSTEKLKELHKSLSGVSLDIFYKVLPLIGSKASTKLIMNLIISKQVPEDVAVPLLQYFPEHVLGATVDLVTELEPLMHLPESLPWNVRKVAILSFGSLIRKSRGQMTAMHHHHKHPIHDEKNIPQSHIELEKPYEKYVLEYVKKMKTSPEYKIQMVYGLGLLNMNLRSVYKHLIPAINGEWSNDFNLKHLSLLAASSSILSDPDAVIEILWPILINTHELVEMRMSAYYFIMQSQPSHSQLLTINSFMITETEEELYHFHYSYVQSMSKSNDPCNELFRVKMAQLLSILPPPSHGISTMNLYDYQDPVAGFSGSFENLFINTNQTRLFGMSAQSQDNHILHEHFSFLVKVSGVQNKDIVPANFIDLFVHKKVLKMSKAKDLHIEAIMLRKQQVVDVLLIDEHNLEEIVSLEKFMTKDKLSIDKNFLEITYIKYNKLIMPSDIGFPIKWEFLIPEVNNHKLVMSKETTNKLVNVHLEYKYTEWVHYRHGFVFYNPIVDVWQGINRYHAYDMVMPINIDITYNMQQQVLQISWKKNSDPLMSKSGLRAHVKQMVFVKDDYNRNLLKQSSPDSEEFVKVGYGKQFRHDYTLVDRDDLNSGLKYTAKIYDSSRHFSNGTQSAINYRFLSPDLKNFNSPWTHLLLAAVHRQHSMINMPTTGTFGYVIKMEPSTKYRITSTDLSMRLNSETSDPSFFYTPDQKWSGRLTYAIKNNEQSLRTWDINAIVDLKSGHTVNNLKMHITRVVPGKQDYKICVDGGKKWNDEGVTGHLNIAMSETADGKCVKDDTVIDITMTGELSNEQKDGHYKYGACEYMIPYSKPHYHTMHCLIDHTTVRHYIYKVKTTQVPTEFRNMFAETWDYFKARHLPYYKYITEHNDDVEQHAFKVDVTYPMQIDEVDLTITTPEHQYKLTAVPNNVFWKSIGFTPDSMVYSKIFEYLHKVELVDHCVIHQENHALNGHKYDEVLPEEWTLYVGDSEENPHKAVYVKQIAKKLAMKIVDSEHTMEVVPHGKSHQITLDGQVVSGDEYHYTPWVYYHIFTQDVHEPIAVMFPKSGFHIEYDSHHMVVVVPKMSTYQQGHCYSHH